VRNGGFITSLKKMKPPDEDLSEIDDRVPTPEPVEARVRQSHRAGVEIFGTRHESQTNLKRRKFTGALLWSARSVGDLLIGIRLDHRHTIALIANPIQFGQ
jgi:hypothetical protein